MGAFTDEELSVLRQAQEAGILTEAHKQAIVQREQEFQARIQQNPNIYPLSAGAAIGMAKAAGGPVDIMTSLANFLGADIKNPMAGSQHLQEMMAEFGMAPHVGEHTENRFVERWGEELGAAPLALIPFSVLARTSQSVHPILQTYRANPKAFVGAEMAAATTAGLGAATAQKIAPDSFMAEFTGQVVGGALNPFNIALKTSKAAVTGLRRMVFPFTKKGAELQAAKRLGEITKTSPTKLIRQIEEPTIIQGLTPGEKTLDPGLIALERAVIRSNAEAEGRFAEMANSAQKAISKELEGLAPGAGSEYTARDLMLQRVDYLKGLLAQRVSNSMAVARDKLEATKGTLSRGEASIVAREEITKALEDARVQESQLYDAIPKDLQTSTTSIKSLYVQTLASRGKAADPEDIPSYVRGILGRIDEEEGKLVGGLFEEMETVDDLRTFRSRLLQSIREEQAKDAPNRTKIHILGEFQEAILQDISKVAEADEAVKLAHSFSKELNDTFTRGTVGKLLGHEKVGGFEVAENLTLTRALSEAGVSAGNAYDDLVKAAANPDSMKQAIQDFMRVQFYKQATDKDGVISPASVKRFLERNEEILNKMPEFKNAIQDADKAQRIANATALSSKVRTKSILDRQKSAAALFLDAPIGKSINRIRNSRNPQATTRQIAQQLSKDKTGRAMAGFKHAWIDEIMGEIQLRKLSDAGEPLLDGAKLKQFVEKNNATLSEVFKPDELKRLNIIAEEASRINAAMRKGHQIDKILDDTPNVLIDMLSRITGAKIGGHLGAGSVAGTTLVAAGAGSRAIRAVTQKIPLAKTRDVLVNAALDQDLMKTLLTKVTSPIQIRRIEQQLHAYLFNAIPREEDINQDVPWEILQVK